MCGDRQKIASHCEESFLEGRRSNDKENFIGSNLMCQRQVRRLCIYWAVYAISKEMFIKDRGK